MKYKMRITKSDSNLKIVESIDANAKLSLDMEITKAKMEVNTKDIALEEAKSANPINFAEIRSLQKAIAIAKDNVAKLEELSKELF